MPSDDAEKQLSVGRFGTPAEFNNLYAGALVSPETRPGLRSAFRVISGPSPVPWSQTVMSRYPNLTTTRVNGAAWHTSDPHNGSVVIVPGNEPANVILTVPTLVEAPVKLEPLFPTSITPQQWEAAGLDPVHQPPMWKCPDGMHLDVRSSFSAMEYEYIQYNGHPAARLKQQLPNGNAPYTMGVPFEPEIDFMVLTCDFGLVIFSDSLLPAGRYVFRRDVRIIPRNLAYGPSPGIPLAELYNNRNLCSHPELPCESIDVIGTMPENLILADVAQVNPPEASPGDVIKMSGARLDKTSRVMFSPGVPADFRIESESLLSVTVPQLAESGLVVVETKLGWVLIKNHFRMRPHGPRLATNDLTV